MLASDMDQEAAAGVGDLGRGNRASSAPPSPVPLPMGWHSLFMSHFPSLGTAGHRLWDSGDGAVWTLPSWLRPMVEEITNDKATAPLGAPGQGCQSTLRIRGQQ